MTSSTTMTGARHRETRRPSTPLTAFGQRLAGPSVRRGVAAVASSGLVLTMAATAAGATPEQAVAAPTDISAVTAEAMSAMVTTPTVTVPATIEWSVAPVAAEATPAPAPEPEPAPVVERAAEAAPERAPAAASRSGERETLTTAAAAAPEIAPASASANQIVNIARQYVGVPYVFGGASPSGFDCSGYTQYVFAQAGIDLPRSSSAQRNAGTVVSAAEARPGDLVWGPGHVGIYTGNGNHIAARNPSTPLYESPIYISNPVFIRVA